MGDLPADRDELAALFWGFSPERRKHFAEVVLASSWLAGVREAARREALRDAAAELDPAWAALWGLATDWRVRARAGVGAVPQTTEVSAAFRSLPPGGPTE